MIATLKAKDRGHFDHGWLDAHHTFSFGDFYDSAQMGFRSLRVINEDRLKSGKGFGMHGHRDMEIITYVLNGALEHARTALGKRFDHQAGRFAAHDRRNRGAAQRVQSVSR